MDFGDPKWLNLLIGVPILMLVLLVGARRRRRDLAAFAGDVLSDALAPGYSWRKALLKGTLVTAGCVLLVVALARPQFGHRLVKVEREGVDLVIALDTSLSMLAEDMKPNRMERAKQEIIDLIRGLQGDRVGLVVFAGDAAVLCPLTVDYDAALMFVQTADIDVVSKPGTALGEAIEKSVALFEDTDRPSTDRAMILVTDGEGHSGEPVEQARRARASNVRIFAIGIGNPTGELIPLRGTDGAVTGYKKDESGETVLTRLDERTLREIAEASGGQYLPATREGLELKVLYREIAGMDKTSVEGEFIERKQERFALVLAGVFVLLFGDGLTTRRSRVMTRRGRRVLHTGIGVLVMVVSWTGVGLAGEVDRGKVEAANEYFGAEDYQKALALYREALQDSTRRSPLVEGLMYNRANALHMLGQHEAAIGRYNQSFTSDSTDVGYMLYNRGNTLMQLGKPAEAVESYVEALGYLPDDEDARVNLELALRAMQEQQQQQQQQQKQDSGDDSQDPSDREEGTSEDQQQNESQDDGNDEDGEDGEQQQQPPPQETRNDSSQVQPDTTRAQPQPVTLTREDALRILRLLEEQEKQLQKEKRKAAFKRISRTGKDW